MPASIFNGTFVKNLKDQLKLADTARILTGTDDPTAVAKEAEKGSVYLQVGTDGGRAFLKQDAGSTTNWTLIGSGGELNFYAKGDMETAAAADFTTGNNATFDGGGTLAGALSFTAVASEVIRGNRTLVYTQSATAGDNDDDYIATDSFAIPNGYRNRFLLLKFQYRSDAPDDTIKVVVEDETNSVILTNSSDFLKSYTSTNGSAKEFQVLVFIPEDCEEIKWGIQVVTGTANAVTQIDDVVVTPNLAYTVADLNEITPWVDDGPITFGATTTPPTKGTTARDDLLWRRVGDSMEIQINYSQTTAGTAGTGTYLITIPDGYAIDTTKLLVNSSTVDPYGPAVGSGFLHNDVTSNNSGDVTVIPYNSTQFYFVITRDAAAQGNWGSTVLTLGNANIDFSCNITVPISGWTATQDHVITPAKSTLSDWIDFTPTGSFVANTTYTGKYMRVGKNMHIQYKLAFAGAPTSTTLTVDVPAGFTVDTADLLKHTENNTKHIGTGSLRDSGTASYGLIGLWNNTNINVIYNLSPVAVVTQAAPITIASGDSIELNVVVPIESWTSDAVFLAAVPAPKYQIKTLSADVTTTTASVTDLAFSNLIVGQPYRISGHTFITDGLIQAINGAQTISLAGIGTTTNLWAAVHGFFVATNSSLTISFTDFGSGTLFGNGTKAETYLALERLSNYSEM